MFEFSTNYSAIFIPAFILFSAFISWLFYRNQILSKFKKYFLTALKALAFFFILMLFIQPVLLSLLGKSGDMVNFILIDNSRSIGVNGKNISADFLKSLFKNGKETRIFTFSSGLKSLNSPDSFNSSGAVTNLSDAFAGFRLMKQENSINSITVISDGNFNSGGSPLYEAKTIGCPIITLPAGDSARQKDIILYNAGFNKTAFIDTKTPVTVYYKAFNTGDIPLTLRLEKDGIMLSEQKAVLKNAENYYSAGFDISESVPGKYKYRIAAENIPGEITYRNNYFDFYIEFIDNKVKILFISGGPSYDNAAISSILKRINNFELTVRTVKSASEFYEGSIDPDIYNSLSAIMMLDFPPSGYNGKMPDEINTNSKRFNIPAIFFAGKNWDVKKLEMYPDIVPFTISQASAQESQVKIQPVGQGNDVKGDISFASGNFPELNRNFKGVIPKAGAITLISDKYSGDPVLITRNNGNFTSTAFLAYGLWQWNLKTGDEKQTGEIIEKTIKLSLNKNKNKKFRITPEKEFFDYSENVRVGAEVFDDNNLPVVNADVKGTIFDKNRMKVKDVNFKINKGTFSADCGKLPAGDYIIEGEAEINNSFFAKDDNRFSVDTLNTEFLQTSNDYEALKELAGNTGGLFIQPANLSETISAVKNPNLPEKKSIAGRINLRENAHFLALIILLFSIEWVIKKRNNIP